MFRTHLLPLCCFTVSFITRINSYTIDIVGTTSVSTNLRTWYSGSYILRFFYLECRHKVTKKSILHIYKLIGTYLILFGISFTHLSHKQFFFSDCFHKILHILHVHSLVIYPILLQVFKNFTIYYYVGNFYKFVNASSKIIFKLNYFNNNLIV